ncbi:hypothetical protein [uncultured Psychrobacillus sp.]|uniref:hypothetical protein n=1 Tax=uncultured Psychrobacillus sp. TaxID=1551585 RepID=UPI00262B0994|nr:hypothetical protein [uncultured Psychrobacillus sp.]
MKNQIVEYGQTLKNIGEAITQTSEDLNISFKEDSEVLLVKLEHDVLFHERITDTLESVSPPKILEKDHIKLVNVFKDVVEDKKNLIQCIKLRSSTINDIEFYNVLKDLKSKDAIVLNILKSVILKLLNNLKIKY